MIERYKEIREGAETVIVEKKSKFIANAARISTEEEALSFLEGIRKKYYDARHHCYAYALGIEQPLLRCSDDGEPSGTAGKPILEVIEGSGIHQVLVVVTRYFGGTLLGTGGLVRAYTQAAQAALEASTVAEMRRMQEVSIRCAYTEVGRVQYLLGNESIAIQDSQYAEDVTFSVRIPMEQLASVTHKLTEITNARAVLTMGEIQFFA